MAKSDTVLAFQPIPLYRMQYNVECLQDIPTGKYIKGKYGENILLGGMSLGTGIVGRGNLYKSAIMNFMSMTFMSHFEDSKAYIYSTEINEQTHRISHQASYIKQLNDEDIVANGRYLLTDKTQHSGNEWFEIYKSITNDKLDNKRKIITPFLTREGKQYTLPYPDVSGVDSLTEFDTDSINDIVKETELGDSKMNTVSMRQGLIKMLMLNQLPKIVTQSNTPIILTAHVGDSIQMDPYAPNPKLLQFLKGNDKIKGVTGKWSFLILVNYQCLSANILIEESTKAAMYPRLNEDPMKGDTDLNKVTMGILRSKCGPSGLLFEIIVSQEEGVKPALTEFHYLKTNDYFGLSGGNRNYVCDLYPNCSLSRTTIRTKTENDPLLRRAITICSEILQMKRLWHNFPDAYLLSPKELYDNLLSKGYDWDILLRTRGWWTHNNDYHPIPFLSTKDLLDMAAGSYHPYWLNDDKKTIKQEHLIRKA